MKCSGHDTFSFFKEKKFGLRHSSGSWRGCCWHQLGPGDHLKVRACANERYHMAKQESKARVCVWTYSHNNSPSLKFRGPTKTTGSLLRQAVPGVSKRPPTSTYFMYVFGCTHAHVWKPKVLHSPHLLRLCHLPDLGLTNSARWGVQPAPRSSSLGISST